MDEGTLIMLGFGLFALVLGALGLFAPPPWNPLQLKKRYATRVSPGFAGAIPKVIGSGCLIGVALGGLAHVAAAALGLSALLATSALAFGIVKYAGAAYLIWLGLRKLSHAPDRGPDQRLAGHTLARVFYEGALVNVLNPKTALFFLAFLPQFVVPSRGDVALQVAILGGLFLIIAFCTDASWSLLASGAGTWLKHHPKYVTSERYVVGSVYLGLGLATAMSGSGRK